MQHEGGCLFGSVRYKVTGDPYIAVTCHCKFCQLRTGSAFGIGVFFPKENIEFTSGAMKTYQYQSDETHRHIDINFCVNCGTSVTWTAEFLPKYQALAGGSFDDPSWFKINRHVWTRSALPWVIHPDDGVVSETI